MGRVANPLALRELHEQRVPFLVQGANFHFALGLAERLPMDQSFAALTQSLASYALNSRDFVEASRLFAVLAKHCAARGNARGEAIAYHQLGRIAEEQREFATAREWYLKSLDIEEKQGNLHGAAGTYHQLGILAGLQGSFEDCCRWLARSIASFRGALDPRLADQGIGDFLLFYRRASPAVRQKLEAIWSEANLGLFPTEPKP